MPPIYQTVGRPAQAEFIEKKSRFIGQIAPASTEEEALAFIQQCRANHREATHNVYAYLLRAGQLKRFSDDGEPQGTAGIPVLEVLQREGLVDVVAVVTRYFGGILLGGGGLLRAYSHSAKIAVDAAPILRMRPCTVLTLTFDYGLYGKLTYLLPSYYVQVGETDFGAQVQMRLTILSQLYELFQKALADLTNGTVRPVVEAEIYADLPDLPDPLPAL